MIDIPHHQSRPFDNKDHHMHERGAGHDGDAVPAAEHLERLKAHEVCARVRVLRERLRDRGARVRLRGVEVREEVGLRVARAVGE